MQALSDGQSALRTHSGLHPSYGFPWYPGIHEQEPAPFCCLQIAFTPHGDGSQGLRSSSSVQKKARYLSNVQILNEVIPSKYALTYLLLTLFEWITNISGQTRT